MKDRRRHWGNWFIALGLALVGLGALVQGVQERTLAVESSPPLPSVQQQEVWSALGLNETWYVAHGYTDAPPPSAPSPFWTGAEAPRLTVSPPTVAFTAYTDQPELLSATVEIDNGGGGTLNWVAELAPGGSFTPTLVPTTGLEGDSLTLSVDSARYLSGTLALTYTRRITVSALPSDTLDSPQVLTASLYVIDHEHEVYLPQVIQGELVTTTFPPPSTPKEVRALWVTRYDWTSAYGSEGPEDVDRIVANAVGAGFNTLFFQVRAHGDAYYAPGLEPWSARLNDDGLLGQHPGWDPLARVIEQAHVQGIQVHAYVNVYPAWLGTTAPPQNTTPQHPFWTWSYAYTWDDWRHWHQSAGPMSLNSGYLWASPGVEGVQDHVVAVVSDIVRRYQVDGVHLDLVRYYNRPYSFDPPSNAAAGSLKTAARDQWQRDQVTDLVGRIYAALQEIRPGTHLSAAVWFCHYADGCGYGLSSGYADYYQDSLGWLSTGVVDAIAPMLYEWAGFDDLGVWRDVMGQFQSANAGRHVYPGISGDFDAFEPIAARIQAARDAGAAGHAIFSYGAVDLHGYWDDFAAGPYALPAASTSLP